METRNHCSGAGGGSGERGRERSPGREAGEPLALLTSVFLFRALFISPPPAALLPERALWARASRHCLPRAGGRRAESSGTPRPRQPRGATGKGGGAGGVPGVRGPLEEGSPAPCGSEETFPALRLDSPPRPRARGAAPPAPRAARRSRSHRTLRPVRARRTRVPSSAALEAQAARKLLLQCPALLLRM
jgi:hypothetical protein